MSILTTEEAILAQLQAAVPDDVEVQIPPPCFRAMNGRLLRYDSEAHTLAARFPVLRRFQNPMGMMQGGFLSAAIDNTLGPLSFLVGPPMVTTELDTSYVRPVPPSMEAIEVEGRAIEWTRRRLYLTARVTSPRGRVLALARATFQAPSDPRGEGSS